MVPVDWRSYISLGLDSSASLPCNYCEYHYFMITCQMAILLLLKRKEKENELTVYFSGSQKCYACSYIMTKVLKMPQSLASNCVLVCHLMVQHFVWQCFLPCMVTSLSLCDKLFKSPSAQYLDVGIWCVFW
jgi:hypothetical protein